MFNDVEINGHLYRYSYDPDTKQIIYDGPVGEGPALSEEEFGISILNQEQKKDFDFYNQVAKEFNAKMERYEFDKTRDIELEEPNKIWHEREYEARRVDVTDFQGFRLDVIDPEGGPRDHGEPFIEQIRILQMRYKEPSGRPTENNITVRLFSLDLVDKTDPDWPYFEVQFDMKRRGREKPETFAKRLVENTGEQIRLKFPAYVSEEPIPLRLPPQPAPRPPVAGPARDVDIELEELIED